MKVNLQGLGYVKIRKYVDEGTAIYRISTAYSIDFRINGKANVR
jgi:hypothetical protein